MNCKCQQINCIQPKSEWTTLPKLPARKPAKPQNIIKIKLADNPKDIVIKFADKETLIKTLREMLSI